MALTSHSRPVVVHLWAGARAAAGVGEVTLDVPGPVTVGWVRDEVVRRFPDAARLPSVLGVCSVLVGERPVGRADPEGVPVEPGDTVEFLPPFAGG
jgi:molybdopterin synthase sulfur carrier subunit